MPPGIFQIFFPVVTLMPDLVNQAPGHSQGVACFDHYIYNVIIYIRVGQVLLFVVCVEIHRYKLEVFSRCLGVMLFRAPYSGVICTK